MPPNISWSKVRLIISPAREGILAQVSDPSLEVLEPIGGTGDTITGIAAALIDSGRSIPEAAVIAARTNRLGRVVCQPHPRHPGNVKS